MKMKSATKAVLAWLGVIFLTGYLLVGCVSTDVGYHCDFTGSIKRWTKWPLGVQTSYNYEVSAIETFVAKNYPDRIEHQWAIFKVAGKNVFGMRIISGHGSPNALFRFPKSLLTRYVEQSSEDDILDLYETLRRNDREEINFRINRLYEETRFLE